MKNADPPQIKCGLAVSAVNRGNKIGASADADGSGQ